MKMNTLKASLLAASIAFGMGGTVAIANDHTGHDAAPERTAGQTVEDATITASIKTKLLADSRTKGFDINVDTVRGVVTLTGGADTDAAKAAATEIANTVDGVVLIKNELTVAAPGTAARVEANTATASGEVRAAAREATDGDGDVDGDGKE